MAYNFTKFKKDCKKVEEWLSREYMQLHTGRAAPSFLDGISVEVYGDYQPIKNIASVNIEDPKTLRVSPWDKGQVKDIERAITAANLGLSLATDEKGLRVIFPMLTAETRTQLVKVVKQKLEDARVSVRKEREAVQKDIEEQQKSGALTEDDKFRAKEDLQKCVDEANSALEVLFTKKEQEVMN